MEPFARLARRVGTDDQLSPTARVVFAALDAFMCKRTGRCDPTFARLSAWVGRHPRNVRRAVRQLEAAGYLAVDRSTGRRNAYRLLPTGGETGGENALGTGGENAPGLGDPYRMSELRTREKEQAPPPPRSVDLFAGHYRPWFTAAVRYHLADVAELLPWVEWFPALAAEFYLSQSWHRQTDPETAVGWARRLAAIAATPAEVAAAFAWALGSLHFDSAGRRVFSRPDHLARIVYRVQSQRKRNHGGANGKAETLPGVRLAGEHAAGQPADRFAEAWADATETERAEVEAAVRRRKPSAEVGGLTWRTAAAEELNRVQARELMGGDHA